MKLKTLIGLILILVLSRNQFLHSQTQLNSGDLLFSAIQWSNGDGFELVTFKDLCPNTVFYASDNAYTNPSGFCNPGAEFTIRFTVTSTITAGSKIRFDDTGAPGTVTTTTGTATVDFPFVAVGGNNTGFNNNTDNCFIFQGTYTSPIFICGIKTNATWTNTGSVNCTNVAHTELPSQLTQGVNALVVNGSGDAVRYNCGTSSGTIATIKSEILNTSNWSNATVHNTTCSFTLSDAVAGVCSYTCSGNIWFEDFNTTKYPVRSTTGTNGNTINSANDWTTNALDCDDATPFGTLSQSYWGTYNGEFLINDVEGGPCTCSGGGTTNNEFITEVIDISNYCNVSISMDFRNTGTMELNTSSNLCNNADDIIQGLYSLNGGAWQQWFFDDGAVNLSPAYINNLSGSTIQLKILVGNKANDERYFFDNICVSGTLKPAQPTPTNCWDNFVFNNATCQWENTGAQDPQPTPTNCWDNFVFNNSTCSWENTGAQDPQPNPTNCWDNFVFNNVTCQWVNTGAQDPQPTPSNCWDNFVFNNSTCAWENTGAQDPQPTPSNCWDNFMFNSATCQWENTGAQDPQPTPTNCWDNFVFNNSTCSWENIGAQDPQSTPINCWDNFVFNSATCQWENTGAQDPQPTPSNCWDNFVFNNTTCAWENTGAQDPQPTPTNCWDNFVFNNATCWWENTGAQDPQPTPTNCWDNFVFNNATCSWENTGAQDPQPTPTNCWDNFVFNNATCSWENTGIQPQLTVSSATICFGQSATITANPNVVGGTLIWNNSQSTNSITVSPIVTTTYSALYSINGCMVTASGIVTVNPIPTVIVASTTICSGESSTLTAVTSISGGTFNWLNNNSTASSIIVSPTSTTTYSVVYSLNGCSSQTANATVTVNSIPSVSLNSITICEGQSALITATPSYSGGTYLWSPNGEDTQSINVSPTSTTSYSVIYTLNGCSSQLTSTTVTVNSIPEVNFSADQLIGCAPLTVQLESIGLENENYSWLLSNGQILAGATTQYTFLQSGCYDVTLTTTENGCSNTLTIEDYICIENPPTAFFTTNPSQISDFSQPTSFINSSTGAVNYIWEFSDGQNSDETNPLLFFTDNSFGGVTANLTAISEFGCESSYSSFLAFNLNTIVEDSNVDVFIPNTFTPDSDESNQIFIPIFSDPELIEEFELNIFNRWGEQIFISFDYAIGWDGTFEDFGNPVQDGVYTYFVQYRIKNSLRKRLVGHINLIR